jgi:hypothetical protein
MRHTPPPFARLAAALVAVVTVSGALAAATAPATESAVKAAFLYNFALFIDWPAETGSGPFTLCVVGEEAVADELTSIARTRTIYGRPVQTRRLSAVDDPRKAAESLAAMMSEPAPDISVLLRSVWAANDLVEVEDRPFGRLDPAAYDRTVTVLLTGAPDPVLKTAPLSATSDVAIKALEAR